MKKNMDCSLTLPSKSTEERIREAAKRVFLEKGFDGATSRDIAEAANINIALTNYYFRSKEKLFISIFEEMLQLFFNGMIEIMNQPISLREKIAELIRHDFQLMKENPSLSLFVMNEVHRNPERMVNCMGVMKQIHHSMFEEQLQKEVNLGTIREINAIHLLPMIFCNIQFLFIGKAMHMKMWQMTSEQFDEFAEKHKNLVIDMITEYLFEFEKA
ncbi:TetR family transcriptional regulator [Spirosoma sp. HMF3257]|uniref:TetR/AcrR family transcriptional regulator n=1 Tax=Spirosoma telluris TaxID=2183553 RepID=A0A327NGP5_9BACT|nr:TetR family transcriptional regulator [Spirosoma telluris]RAI74472.1 TetR/AcrR family transcriptional regulator [Spirosoma telluris]